VRNKLRYLLALLALGPVAASASPALADLVFVNGAVYRVDAARSWASALAVSGGRISYVGDDATARTFIGPATRVIDLNHRMLLPGFQDSHIHPGDYYPEATALDLHGPVQREPIYERIRKFAKAHPEKPWIVGDGWDEGAFPPDGHPTREMLDALVPDRPAFMYNNGGTAGWANSLALAAAHITAATPDPRDGRIEHDARGEPTGMLEWMPAMALVETVIPPLPLAEQVERLSTALEEATRSGITAMEDPWTLPQWMAAYQVLDRRGALQQRSALCLVYDPGQDDDAQIKTFVSQRPALTGHRMRVGCVKFFLDGAYAAHTLALLQPYSDDAKFGSGKVFVEQARLNRVVTRLDAAGFQIHVHAQGDAAVHAALDAFAEARRHNGPLDNRHTIAHLCLIDPADIPRFRELGVIANMSPLWSRNDTWEGVMAPRLFGLERSRRLLQMRTLLDAGAMLVWGSDWPVTDLSPLAGIETAITHRYPDGKDPSGKDDQPLNPQERVNLEQAIVAYTSAGAYLLHDEANRGSLSPGLAADLVVLGRNLFETPPLEIHNVPVDMTVIDGKVVFERNPR
jgi:predicted amidohydrolase YtcJ